jgi:hypothetical protein
MTQKLAGLLIVLVVSSGMAAQTRAAVGHLQVSATIVSSSQLVEQPDGSFRLVVANAPNQAEMQVLQLATNRLNPDVRRGSLQDANTNPSVSPTVSRGRTRNTRH